MKYISLAAHNNELIVVKDMDVFTTYFCYSKKQRHGAIDIPVPAPEDDGHDEETFAPNDSDDTEVQEQDDDIL